MSNNENSVIEYLKTNNEVLFDKIVNALRKCTLQIYTPHFYVI